jgi:PEP-CTERM motif
MRFSLAIGIFGTGLLSAGTIPSNTATFEVSSIGGSANPTPQAGNVFMLNQFNPQPGQTLTGVEAFFTVTESWVDTVMVNAPLGTPLTLADFSIDLFLQIPGFDTDLGSEGPNSCTPVQTSEIFASCSATGNAIGTPQNLSGTPSSLAGYVGSGTIQGDADSQTSITPQTPPGTPGATFFFDSTDIQGSVFLQYTYSTATPEPGSFLLLGGSLVALGLARIRYRRGVK